MIVSIETTEKKLQFKLQHKTFNLRIQDLVCHDLKCMFPPSCVTEYALSEWRLTCQASTKAQVKKCENPEFVFYEL